MEEKLVLVNCLSLLHEETLVEVKGRYHDLVKKAVALVRLPEMIGESDDRASLLFMRTAILDIINNGVQFDARTILQNLRVAAPFDNATYKALESSFNDETLTSEIASHNIDSRAAYIELFASKNEARSLLRSAQFNLNESGGGGFHDNVKKLREQLAKFEKAAANNEPVSFVERVGESAESFTAVFEQTKEALQGAVLKTGWIGLNRMLGINNGIVPGECFVLPALPHNAKTTFSMSLTLSLALFNKAEDFVKEGEKAMILDISLENELKVNIPLAYRMLYEYDTGIRVDLREIDTDEAGKYIFDRLAKNGWHYFFERHIGSDFSIETFRKVVEGYERRGYKIVVSRIDYLGVANKVGLGNGTIGSEVRETYRRARDIGTVRDMVVISPHQLSPAAKALKAMDPDKYLRLLPGRGLTDGCTTIDNEVDGEIFLGIREAGGKSWLELQRGKHRTLVDTPMAHRYIAIPFADVGTLPWDIETGVDTSVRSIAASNMSFYGDDEY